MRNLQQNISIQTQCKASHDDTYWRKAVRMHDLCEIIRQQEQSEAAREKGTCTCGETCIVMP